MRLFFLTFLMSLWFAGISQRPQTFMRIDTTSESKNYWNTWLQDLVEIGVQQNKDTFFIREDVLLALKDSSLRRSLYPEQYTWINVTRFMNAMDLKKAFWHMINLYIDDTTSRSKVIGIFVLYDSLVEMDNILLNVFYTYALADPRVTRFVDKKPEIYRPDILEKKLRITQEIINYIWYNRKQKAGK